MNREDLKQGEYYFNDTGMSDIVFIYNDIISRYSIKAHYYLQIIRPSTRGWFKKDVQISCQNPRLATPEEKHWLDECIRLNKFITKEVAMETFKPEFVLPEKWVLHVDIANLELAKSFIHNHKNDYKGYRESWTISLDGTPCYLHYPQVPDSNAHSSFQIQKDYVEITTEQFKKYVLKEGELQQPSKDASIEEILEYCKKKYPLGTKIKCTKRYTESPYIDNGILTEICYINKGGNIIWAKGQSYYVCIYHDGNYAEIVEETKQESPIKLAEQGHKLYSLEELTKALTKEYDKIDVEDILKVIKTIK